jgi:hypothetical protein
LIANLSFITRKKKEEELNNWKYLLEQGLMNADIKIEHLRIICGKFLDRLRPRSGE